jgi:hypothetical protein
MHLTQCQSDVLSKLQVCPASTWQLLLLFQCLEVLAQISDVLIGDGLLENIRFHICHPLEQLLKPCPINLQVRQVDVLALLQLADPATLILSLHFQISDLLSQLANRQTILQLLLQELLLLEGLHLNMREYLFVVGAEL